MSNDNTNDATTEEEKEGFIYFSIRGGRQRQISREEWESDWLRWWKSQKRKDDR